MGKEIEMINVSKSYGDTAVLNDINLQINAGERIVLLGPSGSGKSTLLRMIAGLEEITKGDLMLDHQKANAISSGDRDIAMVFQNYALYPHMTVEDNITFALKANKVSKTEIKTRLYEALDMLGLTPFRKRLPKDLSGGQRQRTALARAIVKRTDYFLLDEPLSNLDVRLRLDARKELFNIHQKYHQTFVYVTHDQIEAMTLANRIVLLHEGHIQMFDTPDNVYQKPANIFTATFIGSPGMNTAEVGYNQGKVTFDDQKIDLPKEWSEYLDLSGAKQLIIGIRPEHLSILKDSNEFSLSGKVVYKELLGQSHAITIEIASQEWVVLTESDVYHLGETVQLAIDPSKIHFFNVDTTQNIGYPASRQ